LSVISCGHNVYFFSPGVSSRGSELVQKWVDSLQPQDTATSVCQTLLYTTQPSSLVTYSLILRCRN